MSGFRPTRASPLSSSSLNLADSVTVARTVVSDVSRSSAVSVPELTGLSQGDVALLDAVIERAAPSATTFLTVFKAYNDILQERGLDPHEVVYYGKLLKLGTVKGRNWGEKWNIIKMQNGYGATCGVDTKRLDLPKALPPVVSTRLNMYLKPPHHDEDALTLHSDQDDTEVTQSNLDSVDVPQVRLTPSAAARQAIARARERRGSVLNDDEAWNKIKLLRDEKEADRFRDDRLIERCWEVWKEGFRWIIRTNEQVAQARDNVLIRVNLQRWRGLTASCHEAYQRVATLSNNRRLKSFFGAWKFKLKEKRLAEWRRDMRVKMKTIREKREGKLRKDAWAKWRQSYRSHLSGQRYTERLVLRFFQHWKVKLSEVDQLDAAGNEFLRATEEKTIERYWNYWQKAVGLRNAERATREMVSLRVMGEVVDVWKKHARDNRTAVDYYSFVLIKCMIRSWKAARDRIRTMERRAVKHLSRKDDVLLRAVSRVWKARERGRLLERVKAVRLVKDVWTLWRRRIRQQTQLEDFALSFSLRSNSYLASSALQTWREVHVTHQNAYRFAAQYHTAQIFHKTALIWRIRLRSKLKLVKQARIAEKYFLVRRTWNVWATKLDEKIRGRKLQELEQRKRRKYFTTWLQQTRKARQRRLAETVLGDRITTRILHTALVRWTNRVIELKLRELEVAQRNESKILTFALKKWKSICSRHFEELSLMESYRFVKREEDIRRMFHHWLSAARSSRHRRITLQQNEDDVKRTHLAAAWDKWRDRFTDERLRPIEHGVIVQAQNNLLFRAFGMWHSKTKSLPAIRFHASHTKTRAWEIWRQAMPRALQARDAREMNSKTVLTKAFDRWVQAYRTKIALKAVARARYLRLPTATPRSTAPRETPNPVGRTTVPRKVVRVEGRDRADLESRPSRSSPPSRPFIGRTGITSLTPRRPRSEASPPRPASANRRTREPSPHKSKSPFNVPRSTRNTSPALRPPSPMSEVGRSTLWLELREIQRKSGPPTEASQRSREPP